MEGHRNQVALLAHLYIIGYEILIHPVGKGLTPVHTTHESVKFIGSIAKGIEASDEPSHAGAEHHIYRYLLLFQAFDYANVGSSLRSSSAQHQRHGRTLLLPADLLHFISHLDKDKRIFERIPAGGGETDGLRLAPARITAR